MSQDTQMHLLVLSERIAALRANDPDTFKQWLAAGAHDLGEEAVAELMLEWMVPLLTQDEADSLREYLLRGGFLVVDDFHGTVQWAGFMRSMQKVFPDRSIVDVSQEDAIMSMHFEVDHEEPIPGLMAVRYGYTYEHDGYTPTWRGIYDDEGTSRSWSG